VTLVLSRFACLRRQGDRLLAEGPRPGEQVELERRSLALIAALARARSIEDAATEAGVDPAAARELVEPLVAAGVLVDDDAAAREVASPWSFHELHFHTRTRPPRTGFPWSGRQPAPEYPAAHWEATIELERPDLDALERDDPPFARVQANRRSIREHAPGGLTRAQLSEFLYRVGRVEDVWHLGPLTIAARPYPSGGALYPLEMYVAVADCEGLDPGLYHYAADRHRLAPVPGAAPETERLLESAGAGMAMPDPPQALIVLAARLGRLAWKYGPLSYRLALAEAGVVIELMYLTATAMELAGCAIGTGDAETFARATGLHLDEETSIGEFAVGRMRPRRP
jgi:oxazoline/thiazoline dehydrogenase